VNALLAVLAFPAGAAAGVLAVLPAALRHSRDAGFDEAARQAMDLVNDGGAS
jgi:hypothetical protein